MAKSESCLFACVLRLYDLIFNIMHILYCVTYNQFIGINKKKEKERSLF